MALLVCQTLVNKHHKNQRTHQTGQGQNNILIYEHNTEHCSNSQQQNGKNKAQLQIYQDCVKLR